MTRRDWEQAPRAYVIEPERVTYAAVREIAEQLTTLSARLGHMHLMRSMHALTDATRVFGFEAAEKLEELTI